MLLEIYDKHSMVHPDHIKVIDQQLQKYGSKVPEDFLDEKEHALPNVLRLALGEGSYKVDLVQINKIGNHEFSLNYSR